MTMLDAKKAPAGPSERPGAPSRTAPWLRDLWLGIRFAADGGREGWIRTLLTAVGVGIGVALLLTASSVPHMLDERSARDRARSETKISESPDASAKKSDSTVLRIEASTEYHDRSITGFLMRADGDHPVVPPGIGELPAPGEMVVSPRSGDSSTPRRTRCSRSGCRTRSPARSRTRACAHPASCGSTRAATPSPARRAATGSPDTASPARPTRCHRSSSC